MKQVVDPTYAKSSEYKKVIESIADEGKCPFCPDNFRYHKRKTLKTNGDWLITNSSWPYENAKFHFLLINKKHKEEFSELKLSDFASVMKLVNWAVKEYQIKGGGLTLRFGDTKYTGATVCHLHFHLISPELDKKTNRGKTINFPIG